MEDQNSEMAEVVDFAGRLLTTHRDIEYADDIVYATGNSYIGCSFLRCTIVVTEVGFCSFHGCSFVCVSWHLNVHFYDRVQFDAFNSTAELIGGTLPDRRTATPEKSRDVADMNATSSEKSGDSSES
jgi:hypothetical protein